MMRVGRGRRMLKPFLRWFWPWPNLTAPPAAAASGLREDDTAAQAAGSGQQLQGQ